MPQNNYILDLLNIKDKNINFDENGIHDEFIKNKTCKVIDAHLSYIPTHCDKCGCAFESNKDYEKKGFDKGSYVVVPSIFKMTTFLFLKKQRILCHHCKKSFSLRTDLVNFKCRISNITKLSIVVDLTKKRSEKDISIDNNVSPNTIERVMDSYYDGVKLYKNHLPNSQDKEFALRTIRICQNEIEKIKRQCNVYIESSWEDSWTAPYYALDMNELLSLREEIAEMINEESIDVNDNTISEEKVMVK